MNEIVAVFSFAVLATFVIVAARLGTISLFVLSATYILLSNITVQLVVPVFGVDVSWAIIIYSLVYFITDLICEFYGKNVGYRLAATNLTVQFVLWIYVWLSLKVAPGESEGMHATMEALFATTRQVTFAAILAAVGPFLDIYVFTWVRERWDRVALRYRASGPLSSVLENRAFALVLRNKLSTFAGQIVNTVIFFTLALFGTGQSVGTLASIILTACIVKIVVAIADIPFLLAAQRFLLPSRPAAEPAPVLSATS